MTISHFVQKLPVGIYRMMATVKKLKELTKCRGMFSWCNG